MPYPLNRSHRNITVRTLQIRHASQEKDGIDESSDRLVQKELDGGISFVQRPLHYKLLSFIIIRLDHDGRHCICREAFLEKLLPQEVGRRAEQSEDDEVDNRCCVKGEAVLG